jgi:hypothetical protein
MAHLFKNVLKVRAQLGYVYGAVAFRDIVECERLFSLDIFRVVGTTFVLFELIGIRLPFWGKTKQHFWESLLRLRPELFFSLNIAGGRPRVGGRSVGKRKEKENMEHIS